MFKHIVGKKKQSFPVRYDSVTKTKFSLPGLELQVNTFKPKVKRNYEIDVIINYVYKTLRQSFVVMSLIDH